MADLCSRDQGKRLFVEFIHHSRPFKSSLFIGKHGHMPSSGDAISTSLLGTSSSVWHSLEDMGVSPQSSQMVMEESRLCLKPQTKPQTSWVA